MSYSPVYSTQFIVYGSSAGALEFAVPAGFTAVIRDASADATATAATVTVLVQNSDAAPAIVVARMSGAGIPFYSQWQGRVVCPGGGTISASATELGADVSIYVGGYLLRDTVA